MEPSAGLQSVFLRRNIVGILAFLGFINVYALRVNLSVAIVDMTTEHRVENKDGSVSYVKYFDWSPKEKGNILSAFFYGYILTQLAGGWLGTKFGGAKIFGSGIAVTAFLNLLTPFFARLSLHALIILRIIEGFFEGVTYPCIHAVWSRWAPPAERTRLASLAFSGSFVGTVVSFPACGIIIETLGWPYTFYIPGVVGLIWCVIWFTYVKDNPIDDPYITKDELKYLTETLGEPRKKMSYPWKRFLTSLPVWAIVVAHFCENWGFYTLLTQLPTFLSESYSYDITKAGFLSALPYLFMSITLIVAGAFVDMLRRRKVFTTTQVRKIFNCGAFLSQTVFMIGAGYVDSAWLAITCLTLAVGLGSFAWTAFSVNPLDIAPQYAGVIMGISNTFATISGIVAPNVAGYVVSNKVENSSSWRTVFILAACIYMVGAMFYGTFASGDRQTWAIDEVNDTKTNGVAKELRNGVEKESKKELRNGIMKETSTDNKEQYCYDNTVVIT